jgi:c-di-AMP phosphodiesterase-like protein
MAADSRQINFRPKPDRFAILEAAAFVLNKGAPSKLVQELVDEAVDRYAELPAVQKALEARREQAAASEGKLSHLPSQRLAAE